MNIYDQHLHSFLSCDSTENFEEYLKIAQRQGAKYFISTEHLDLSSLYLGKDDIFDLEMQEKLRETLQKKYSVKILKGVEMGYKFSRIKEMEAIVNNNNFDLVILSVHETETVECALADFHGKLSPHMAYENYLELYIDMLENCDFFDVVGHIDFLLRFIDRINIEENKNTLTKLLKLVISKDKCLEFNTKFIYQQKDSSYLEYIFSLYFSLGGRKVSLGSDAHSIEYYRASFNEAIEILKKIGFTHISHFQKRKEIAIEI